MKPRKHRFSSLRKLLPVLGILLLTVIVTGCGGGGGGNTDQQPPVVPTTHGISGRITLNGAGMNGITVNLGGPGVAGVTSTDTNGTYSFTGLADGSYTVTATSADYTFTPATRQITIAGADQANQDFTAAANTGTIVITF